MPAITIQSHAYQQFRKQMKADWAAVNAPCGICGQSTIVYDGPKNQADSFELDHAPVSRKRALAMGKPELLLDPSNAQPSHVRCNRSKQAGDPTPQLGEVSEDW